MKISPSIYENRWFNPVLIFLSLLLLIAGIYIITILSTEALQRVLQRTVPWSLRLNFFLIVLAIFFCRQDLAVTFGTLFAAGQDRKHSPGRHRWYQPLFREGWVLIAVVAASMLLVHFVPFCSHRIYYDEDIYGNVGQNIALLSQTGLCNFGTFVYGEYFAPWLAYNKEPSGWPFLISLAFQLLGVDEQYAFGLNNLIYAGNVLVVFFMARLISGDRLAACFAAIIMALIPHHLIWSNTAAAEPSAAFFTGLSMLCLLIYLRSGLKRHLFLLVAIVPFACQMRPESGLLLLLLVCTALLFLLGGAFFGKVGSIDGMEQSGGKGIGQRFLNLEFLKGISLREGWILGLMFLLLLCPCLIHIHAVGGQSWDAPGSKFSADFFLQNLRVNGLYYLNNQSFPLIFTILAVIGLLSGNRQTFGERLSLWIWFLLFWGIFLFFYAGSYRYGADVRFALVSFMPLAALAGLGAGRMGELFKGRGMVVGMMILLIFSWLQFLPLIRVEGQEAWPARYDHQHAKAFMAKIPRRSIVFTHIPTMFLLWGQSAVQSYAALNNPELVRDLMHRYAGQVYFHENYWCNAKNSPQGEICRGIRERYDLEEIALAREQTYTYGLYRMEMRREERIKPASENGCR